jgi:hypothetical protein
MSNLLSETKRQQVIALGKLGWPLRRIEQETGVRRETAGAYLKAAGIGVRPPGAWGRRPPAKPANENEVTTGSDVAKPANTVNPNPNPENLSTKEKAKTRAAKPANENEVTTGSDVAKPANTVNPNPNPENLSTKEKAKTRAAKPTNENEVTTGSDAAKPANENEVTTGSDVAKPANAGEVTTGFGVELSTSEPQSPPPVPSTSLCEPFREAIELGLSQGRNATGIWQLCRSRNSCQNAEFGPMPSGHHLFTEIRAATPIATAVRRVPLK